jgi:hypothetical protein
MPALQMHNGVHFGTRRESWASLGAATTGRLGPAAHHAAARTVFVVADMEQALGAIAYGIQGGLDFGVVERNRLSPEVETRFAQSGVQLIDAQSGAPLGMVPAPATPVAGRITVLTSGTTGLLKLIPHTAQTLNTFDRVRDMPAQVWFLPYQPGSRWWLWACSCRAKTLCRAILPIWQAVLTPLCARGR